MSVESELVGRNLHRIRGERGLSMGELARRAGLSKQTLSILETGGGNPTVETLAALATGLGVSMRRLVTEWGSPLHVQRTGDAAWQEAPGRQIRELGQIYGSGYVRSFVLRLSQGDAAENVWAAMDAGALHHAYIIEGNIRCGTTSEAVELEAGDFARFPADVPHLFQPLSLACVAHVVTTMPQRAQFGLAR